MDETRRELVQSSRSVAEQARAAKQVETVARDLSRIAATVTEATSEQKTSVAELVREADAVRKISKQTARIVNEQAAVLKTLASGAAATARMIREEGSKSGAAEQ